MFLDPIIPGIHMSLLPFHPAALPFYPLRLGEADAVISQAFNTLSHPPASPHLKSRLLSVDSPRRSSYLLGGAASDVKLEEAGVNARLRGVTTIRLLHPPPLPSLSRPDY